MKLSDHVDKIRVLTHKSFSNYFTRLGITAKKVMEIEKLPTNLKAKREKVDLVIKSNMEETGSFAAAYEKTLDEYTFTLFNRIAAVKVMEAHRMFPEVITKRPENGNRSFSHKAWLENNKDMTGEELEGIRQFIKFEFNRLGMEIPLYHKDYPYALLPYVIELNEIIDAFNVVEKDSDIEDAIWQSDDILGWLYESYNNAKKLEHKTSKKKTEYDKVSLQSQVYTPRWVVKFLVDNSLGKLYLEMYPDSHIKNKYKIANVPENRVRDTKPLHEVTIIDPAVGSGNFLFYSFDLFYDLYIDQIDNYGAHYDEDEIPKLIIENNLHGVDIDHRAVQIAQLGLFIKAMRKRRDIHIENFNVVSSDFVLPDYEKVQYFFKNELIDKETTNLLKETWADLQMAHKFGSLVRIEEKVVRKIKNIKKIAKTTSFGLEGMLKKWENWKETIIPQIFQAVDKSCLKNGDTFLGSKTKEAFTYLSILNTRYDIAVANPPYTESANYGIELKKYINENYKKGINVYENLYSCFFKRLDELILENGYVSMITPMTFMFLSSFKEMREAILNYYNINLFCQMGFGGIFQESIDPALFCIKKTKTLNPSYFIKLDFYFTGNKNDLLKEAINDFIEKRKNRHNFTLIQNEFKKIRGWPFIYWISNDFRKTFSETPLGHQTKVCQGLATGDNSRFVRYWWEVFTPKHNNKSTEQNDKWVNYAKGGKFNRWYGNLWLVVNWRNDGYEIKNFLDKNGKQRSRPQNEKYYFKEGITYSASGRGGYAFRYLPANCIFDVGGSSIFQRAKNINLYYTLAFLNSKLSFYIADCLNPTANIQVGDLERIPIIFPSEEIMNSIAIFSKNNVLIRKMINSYSILEHNYRSTPIEYGHSILNNDFISIMKIFINFENFFITQILLREALINEKIFEIYNLSTDDKALVIEKEGESVGNLPVLSDAKKAFLDEGFAAQEFPLDDIREFIKNLSEKNVSMDNFNALYQKSNDFEEFCIRNQMNPINVWYWFKVSNVMPKQRMNNIAMEFLADLIRSILMEDKDGIVPLVRSAGEEILIDRIEKKFIEKGFTSAQFASFDRGLGRELNDYLNGHFFKELSDYLNLFMYLPKTPFIWHITSGQNHGFDAFIIIYKWNRDRLYLLKSVYIEKRETALNNRRSDLQNDNSAKALNEKDLISKQLKEIENLKTKIDELLAEGYNPVLDDGVGKNIAPLQKKGIIAYDVLNKGQLEKYLNADW